MFPEKKVYAGVYPRVYLFFGLILVPAESLRITGVKTVDAIVTAGGIPQPGDPLYEFTQGRPKALLELAGKPMVQWVLDALGEAKKINHIVVVGLGEESQLASCKPLYYLPNQGGMLENIFAGAQKLLSIHPASQAMVSVSSDVPAITRSSLVSAICAAIGLRT